MHHLLNSNMKNIHPQSLDLKYNKTKLISPFHKVYSDLSLAEHAHVFNFVLS